MENYWVRKKIDLGEVLEETIQTYEFESLVNIPPIVTIKAGCGCTETSFDQDSGILIAKLDVGKFPYHLKQQNTQQLEKMITVTYQDGTQDVLTLIATKTKKI